MATISTSTTDNEGIASLVGPRMRSIQYVNVKQSSFANPGSRYTGFAADGRWYTSGVYDPSHSPAKASWASEAEASADLFRGVQDSFPDRIFVMATNAEVVILDADTLDVWMRFVRYSGITAHTYGSFLGDSTVTVYQACFHDGYLVVATSLGLRIADFRNDTAFVLASTSSYESSLNLEQRNSDGFLEGALYVGEDIIRDNALCVDVGYISPAVDADYGGKVVAAVGTSRGLSAVTLFDPDPLAASPFKPTTNNHSNFSTGNISDWETLDDNDADLTTPYIARPAPSLPVWISEGIRPGDLIVLKPSVGADIKVEVVAVDADKLTVTPEVDITKSGSIHKAHRRVPSVSMTPRGGLIFANGHQTVCRIEDPMWYDATNIDPWTGSAAQSIVNTSSDVGEIRRVRSAGTSAFIATDIGIFYASEGDFDLAGGSNFGSSTYWYGISSSSARYPVLEGTLEICADVVVDDETGNILVATVDDLETESVVTEIDPTIQQAFQFFGEGDVGVVTCLASYRNTEGPPDDEEGVA